MAIIFYLMVSTQTEIYHQNHLSLLGKRQGGNEDFQSTKKLIETKMTQSSICNQKIKNLISFTALWSQASRHASIPSLAGMLVYNDVTSIEKRMVPESEENPNRFFAHVNNVPPTIKFTHETSRNNISFLDNYTT
jgi:hypothetical protein